MDYEKTNTITNLIIINRRLQEALNDALAKKNAPVASTAVEVFKGNRQAQKNYFELTESAQKRTKQKLAELANDINDRLEPKHLKICRMDLVATRQEPTPTPPPTETTTTTTTTTSRTNNDDEFPLVPEIVTRVTPSDINIYQREDDMYVKQTTALKALYFKDKSMLSDTRYGSMVRELDELRDFPRLHEIRALRLRINELYYKDFEKIGDECVFVGIKKKIRAFCLKHLDEMRREHEEEQQARLRSAGQDGSASRKQSKAKKKPTKKSSTAVAAAETDATDATSSSASADVKEEEELVDFADKLRSYKLRVKLSADGTLVGQNINFINFTFQIICDSVEKCRSVERVKTIGLAEMREKHENLEAIYAYMMAEIRELSSVEFHGVSVPVHYYYCADWKYLAIVCGLYGANSNWPCIFCHWSKTKSAAAKELAAPTAKPDGPRTLEFQATCLSSNNNHYGYKHASLLTDIPIKNIIIDTLHLKIRILDKLTNLLLRALCDMDAFHAKSGPVKPGKHVNLTRWLEFVRTTCKIKREQRAFNDQCPTLFTREFSGGEYSRVLERINVCELFPTLERRVEIDKLWRDFETILKNVSSTDAAFIKRMCDDWHELFVSIYGLANVTPYIHALHTHVHELIAEHGNITLFDQQSVEKLNDFTTREYFMCTNKHNFKTSASPATAAVAVAEDAQALVELEQRIKQETDGTESTTTTTTTSSSSTLAKKKRKRAGGDDTYLQQILLKRCRIDHFFLKI